MFIFYLEHLTPFIVFNKYTFLGDGTYIFRISSLEKSTNIFTYNTEFGQGMVVTDLFGGDSVDNTIGWVWVIFD